MVLLEKYQIQVVPSDGTGLERQDVVEKMTSPRPKMSESLRLLAVKARQDALKAGRERALKAAGRSPETKEGSEVKENIAKDRFNRIWNFQENIEFFKNEDNGWRKEYVEGKDEQKRPYKEKVSLEQFVYDQQLARLTSFRNELITERVSDSFESLYPDIEEDKIDNKKIEVGDSIKLFFDGGKHSELIDKWELQKIDGVALPEQEIMLLEMFGKEVFSDISKQSSEYAEVVSLFKLTMNDYLEMQDAKRQLYLLNDEMVAMMSDEEMTEEKWLQELAKAAEEEAVKQKEIEDAKEAEKQFFSSGIELSDIGFGELYYSGQLNAGENLSRDTKIRFESLGNGAYKIVFPPDEDGRSLESRFFARRIDGKETYLFADEFMEKPYQVGVVEGVNRAYLERLMGQGLRFGEDYRGPNLNEGILPDEDMFKMARNLFSPVNIENQPINKQQANVFKRVLEIIVSPGNNSEDSSEYGSLLPVRRRVQLLQMIFAKPGIGQKCFNLLKDMQDSEVKNYSVSALCKKLGIAPNYGRF